MKQGWPSVAYETLTLARFFARIGSDDQRPQAVNNGWIELVNDIGDRIFTPLALELRLGPNLRLLEIDAKVNFELP